MGRLRVKALEEVYEKRVLDDSKECEHQVFSFDEDGDLKDMVNFGPVDSDIDSLCTSEPPVEVAKEPTAFPTKPPTEYLHEKLKPESVDALEKLLVEFEDIFCTNKTYIGFTNFIEHDIELKPGAEPTKETYRRLHLDKRDSAVK